MQALVHTPIPPLWPCDERARVPGGRARPARRAAQSRVRQHHVCDCPVPLLNVWWMYGEELCRAEIRSEQPLSRLTDFSCYERRCMHTCRLLRDAPRGFTAPARCCCSPGCDRLPGLAVPRAGWRWLTLLTRGARFSSGADSSSSSLGTEF